MAVARSAVAWIGCMALLSSLCMGAERQGTPEASIASRNQDEQASFDIPPQPLVTALRAYSEATGIAVLVDTGLTESRASTGVHGKFGAAAALQQLLLGTGLVARYASRDAFTLALDEREVGIPLAANDGSATSDNEHPFAVAENYGGSLQAEIEKALCRSERTRPGSYRLAMQVWISPAGAVERTKLLDSVGSDAIDAEIIEIMAGVRIDPPPAGMPQPLTILLLPRPLDRPFVCRTNGTDRRVAEPA